MVVVAVAMEPEMEEMQEMEEVEEVEEEKSGRGETRKKYPNWYSCEIVNELVYKTKNKTKQKTKTKKIIRKCGSSRGAVQ